MFKDLSRKLGELKMPEESLIKKLERIKKTADIPDASGPAALSPDVSAQLKNAQEEMAKRIEELVNSKAEQIKTNVEAVKNLESNFSKIEQMVSSGKKGTDEFKDRLDKIDETVLELLSLYEVVSSTVNPFVGDKDNPMTEKLLDIERKVEEISNKSPEIPSSLIEDFDIKIRNFENNVEELKKIVESNAINEEILVERVTEQVMDRTKPLMEQITESLKESKSAQDPQSQNSDPSTQQIDQTGQDTDQRGQDMDQTKPDTVQVPQYVNENNKEVRLSYLDNRPETSIILLSWIEFLLEKVGRNNLIDVLEYYIEICWISEEVSSKMMDYASGIDYYVERPSWKLLPEDHTKSLLFIEQLRGRKIDKNLLSRLERDLEKIVRSSEILVP